MAMLEGERVGMGWRERTCMSWLGARKEKERKQEFGGGRKKWAKKALKAKYVSLPSQSSRSTRRQFARREINIRCLSGYSIHLSMSHR